ncbi:MAG: hypothetical protein EBS06_05830 [Proteobacteria bacterium]|nr:hypothetical protein [Pseudomonadota bacterium]
MNKKDEMLSDQESQDLKEISIGNILRKKRIKLNIKPEEVASYLRIKLRDIEAIENDDLSKILKHSYVPGLLRSYANFLKIDARIFEKKIKLLHIESNTHNKKHQLLNIGENIDLTPDKDIFLNFSIISTLLFFILLSIYNFVENKSANISSESLVEELKKID